MLITVEGIDGCGKSTLIKNIKKGLNDLNVYVELIKFPSEEETGQMIYHELNNGGDDNVIAELFARDFKNSAEKIKSMLLPNNKVYIADRYIWSYEAYQSVSIGEKAVKEKLEFINAPEPDVVILITVNPGEALERLRVHRAFKDSMESKGENFLNAVQTRFEKIATEKSAAGKVRLIKLVSENGKQNDMYNTCINKLNDLYIN